MTRRDLEQRLANTTWSRPPSDVPMAKCWCGGAYMDTDIGADSHEVVMGHRPSTGQPTNPAGRDTTPALHQSAAPQRPSVPDGIGHARDPTTGHGQNEPPDDDEPRE